VLKSMQKAAQALKSMPHGTQTEPQNLCCAHLHQYDHLLAGAGALLHKRLQHADGRQRAPLPASSSSSSSALAAEAKDYAAAW
jgi:hypothetical protein